MSLHLDMGLEFDNNGMLLQAEAYHMNVNKFASIKLMLLILISFMLFNS